MRWWTGSQLMLMLLQWVVMWSTHHMVVVRSTNRWGCISLLVLAFLMNTDGIIRNDGIAHKFQESPINVECKTLLKRWGCISLLVLDFQMSMDGVICNDGIAQKFQESPISVERKALLKLGG
jgi:hypothetical protein